MTYHNLARALAYAIDAAAQQAFDEADREYKRVMFNGDPDDAQSDAAFEERQRAARLSDAAIEAVCIVEDLIFEANHCPRDVPVLGTTAIAQKFSPRVTR